MGGATGQDRQPRTVQATGEERRALLEELTDRHDIDDLGGQTHLIEGSPGHALPKLAERLNINVIVMGTVARRGLSGLIMGNTAETMLRAVHCSILTVKPDGFVSPITPDDPT
ncbi:MAG: universal stress protein [Acidimicrobiia bacterium]|nr:universal stress protein [Acidimicrobiia bacterium]